MRKLKTRERIGLGGLAISLLIYWYGVQGTFESSGANAGTAMGEPENLGDPPLVRLDLLDRGASEFDPLTRDLFSYHEPVRPGPPSRNGKPKGTRRELTPREPESPSPSAPARPQPAFAYVGFLGPKDAKIAVFAKGTEVLVARLGDIVEDGFELLEFRHDAVVLKYTRGRYEGETTMLGKSSG